MRNIKQWIPLLLIAALLSGCAESPTGTNSSEPESQSAPSSSQADQIIVTQDPLVVADAALYRGTVTQIDGDQITLEQEPGRDFGQASIQFLLDGETTKCNFDASLLEEGMYLEIYYGSGDTADNQVPRNAIAINYLGHVEQCIWNGEVTSLSDKDGYPTLEIQSLQGDSSIIFRTGEETKFYLNQNDIQVGDLLNIYYSGILTDSLPPQGFALEVSPYEETTVFLTPQA